MQKARSAWGTGATYLTGQDPQEKPSQLTGIDGCPIECLGDGVFGVFGVGRRV